MQQPPQRTTLFTTVIAGLALVAVTAIGCGNKSKATASAEPSSSAAAPSSSEAGPTSAQPDGRFVWHFEPSHDPKFKHVEPIFKDGPFEALVTAMGVFALPRNVTVLATDVGPCLNSQNAFYSNSKHAVYLCYALVDAFFKGYKSKGKSSDEASQSTLNAMLFSTLHEMGHAIIQELEIGITGKEEDAVDELATLILIDNKKPKWAVDGGKALVDFTAETDKNPAYFDEHSLSPQRLGDILCMVYGSDPETYANFEKSADLRPRLPKCKAFYDQKRKAWESLVDPHYRKE